MDLDVRRTIRAIPAVLVLTLSIPLILTPVAGASESWTQYQPCGIKTLDAIGWLTGIENDVAQKNPSLSTLVHDAKEQKIVNAVQGCVNSPDKILNNDLGWWALSLSKVQLDIISFAGALQFGVGSSQKTGEAMVKELLSSASLMSKADKRLDGDFKKHHISPV